MHATDLLVAPRTLTHRDEGLTLTSGLLLALGPPASPLLPCARRLQRELAALGLPAELVAAGGDAGLSSGPSGGLVSLRVDPTGLRGSQSYRLEVGPVGVHITGADLAGVFYGSCTLVQLLQLHGPMLPGLEIEDWPDFAHRGVMLDVSRDRVPRMEMLLDWIDLLASWKINQLQLYMEHTFAYRGHDVVWRDASPFTGEQILLLDAYCRERHVELVPNQNSFGHMHRWLAHDPYRALAECPEGIDHPFSPDREPYSLCPTDPGSLALLQDLYGQLLPHFTSRQVNTGLDETFDLGRGRSAGRCAQIGTERVYLEFLHQVHRLVGRSGHRMQFWGDIILKRPELVLELPRDAVALEWGYEADHPFEVHTRHFADAGLEFYVCPGTSSWNSIAGRTDNALSNLAHASVCGHAAGAAGLLITDWGDNGHLQPPPVSLAGFAAGAAFAWNREQASDPDPQTLAPLLSRHAFRDGAGSMGRVALELGNVYLATGVSLRNGTILSRLLLTPDAWPETRIPSTLTAAGLEHALERIEAAVQPLDCAAMGRPDAELIRAEYRWAAQALEFACRIGLARLESGLDRPLQAVAGPVRSMLHEAAAHLIEGHRTLWLQRSRPGGLEDSAARLRRTLEALV